MDELIGIQLWTAALCWQRTVNRLLAPHDLTHRQFVLLAGVQLLDPTCDCVTQAALAEVTHGDPMTVSTVARALERRGLLTRSPHPTDARAHSLSLTKAGRSRLKKAQAMVEQLDEDLFGGLDPSVLQTLRALHGATLSHGDE